MAIDQLATQLSWRLKVGTVESPILVATAQLELADKPLHVQIEDFVSKCDRIGIERVVILPLFLIPGVHVMEDIPAEVAIARDRAKLLHSQVTLRVASFLGSDREFANLFAQHRSCLPSQSIILAHGSWRSGGNTIVEKLASNLDLKAAYWSVAPSLTDRVAELIAAGATEIGILPYFLFAGGITDAIAHSIDCLRQQHPQVKLKLGQPIGNSPELVTTIGTILGAISQEKSSANDI
jgi:sirohydrochlorin cobaltochelatase